MKASLTLRDKKLLTEIKNRIINLPLREFAPDEYITYLKAAHTKATALDFKKLLDADDFNFVHDVFGIRNNLDLKTGKFKRCFLPRCFDYKSL